MRINIEYKEKSNLNYNSVNIMPEYKEWFISNINYYQSLLCKINLYIQFYNRLHSNLSNAKTYLPVIFLETFCSSIAHIVYKLFGQSNENSILKFRNAINSLYNVKKVTFKAKLKFSKIEKQKIYAILETRHKVYGHSDDKAFDIKYIDDLISSISINDLIPIMNKCITFINNLWTSFCDHDIAFELQNDAVLMDAFNDIIKII